MAVASSYWNGDVRDLSPLLKDNTPGALFTRITRTWITAFLLLNARAKNLVINTTTGHRVIPDAQERITRREKMSLCESRHVIYEDIWQRILQVLKARKTLEIPPRSEIPQRSVMIHRFIPRIIDNARCRVFSIFLYLYHNVFQQNVNGYINHVCVNYGRNR